MTSRRAKAAIGSVDFRLEESDDEENMRTLPHSSRDLQNPHRQRVPASDIRQDNSDEDEEDTRAPSHSSITLHRREDAAPALISNQSPLDSGDTASLITPHDIDLHDWQNVMDEGYHQHVCPVCMLPFQSAGGLRRHWKTKHPEEQVHIDKKKLQKRDKLFSCPQCEKHFAYRHTLKRHLRKSHSAAVEPPIKKRRQLQCEQCQRDFSTKISFQKHVQERHTDQDPPLTTEGKEASALKETDSAADTRPSTKPKRNFSQERAQKAWRKSTEGVPGLPPPDPIMIPDRQTLRAEGYDDELIDFLQEEFEHRWSYIRTNYRARGDIVRSFNFRLSPPEPALAIRQMRPLLTRVHRTQSGRYKINIGFGFMTRPIPQDAPNEDTALRYLYPSEGNALLFPTAPMINNRDDLIEKVLDAMEEDDIINFVSQLRESTKVRVIAITNMRVYIYPIQDSSSSSSSGSDSGNDTRLAGRCASVPEFVRNSKYILPLLSNPNTGQAYNDNCCVFRAIAVFEKRLSDKTGWRNVEARVREMKQLYITTHNIEPDSFCGVKMTELERVEHLFKIRCQVYLVGARRTKGRIKTSVLRWAPEQTTPEPTPEIGLCLWERDEGGGFVHVGLITDSNKLRRTFACPQCDYAFDRIDNFRRHCATCRFVPEKRTSGSAAPVTASKYEMYKQKLRPPGGGYKVPGSVFDDLRKAGVLGIEPSHRIKWNFCFYDFETYSSRLNHRVSPQQVYTDELIPLCVSISAQGIEDLSLESVCFIDRLEPANVVKNMVDHMLKLADANYASIRPRYEYIFSQLEKMQSAPQIHEKLKRHYKTLSNRLEEWLRCFPCFGFNSSRFDIPLIRQYLLPYLMEVDAAERNEISVLKRGNAYLKVQTRRLCFLDTYHFLAPNFSYSSWLRAYQVEEGKFVFPHSYLRRTDLDALLDCDTLPPIEVFRNDLTSEDLDPKTYQLIQNTWRERGWTCMQDYLLYYARMDTDPARVALTKMISFWAECIPNLPVNLSDSVSLPGLAVRFFAPSLNTCTFVPLANSKTSDFYLKIRDQIVGGPSIIWTRRHHAGETKLRAHMKDKENSDQTCRGVFGFDANGLYLYCLGAERFSHATGIPVRWRYNVKTNRFTKSRMLAPGVSHAEIEWLIYEAKRTGQNIEHYYNNGQWRLPGRKFRFDGVCFETRTCYNFNGCYYHPHAGCSLANPNRTRSAELIEKKRKEREDGEEFARRHGWTVCTMTECEWTRLKDNDPSIVEYLSEHLLMQLPSSMSKEQLLDRIKRDQWFGYIEADVECEPGTEAWERCQEMSPIFRHAILSQSSGGPHMEAYAKKHNLKPARTRMLIGAMNARKMIFASPLLKFLISLGLKITQIYDCYQFVPKKLFEPLAKLVVEKRREADADITHKIKGDSMKLAGNSMYGKTIEQPLKKHQVRIVSNRTKLSRCIKDPRFVHVECLLPDQKPPKNAPYEVTIRPKKYMDKAPCLIGFTVLQYAKLRLLEFYYDYIDKYFPRKEWELLLCDTDSLYLAASRDNWTDFENECVRPELQEDYARNRNQYLPRTDTEEHRRYDERELGLFKCEFSGAGVVATNSKTYFAYSMTQAEFTQKQAEIYNNVKLSLMEQRAEVEKLVDSKKKTDKFVAKGVNKRQNPLEESDYQRVLQSGEPHLVTNRGLRMVDIPAQASTINSKLKRSAMVHYELQKVGVSFGYWKRVSDANLINTYPPPLTV